MSILPAITSLMQYLGLIKNGSGLFRPERCPHCGRCGMWCHGYYYRKTDRERGLLNPIPIPRFICPHCGTTCSVLPECIPPRRWYLWKVQEAVFALICAGNSIKKIAKNLLLSRHTINRWWARLKNQYHLHKDALCNHLPGLGLTSNVVDFWKACLGKISLGQAMYLCHASGVNIP